MKKFFLIFLALMFAVPAFAQSAQPIQPIPTPLSPPTREEFNEFIKRVIEMKKELVEKMEKIQKELVEVKTEAQKAVPQKPNSPVPSDPKTLKDLERRIVHAQRGVNKLEKIVGGQPNIVGWGPNDTKSLAYALANLSLNKSTKALNEANKTLHKAENAQNRADMAFSRATQAQLLSQQNANSLRSLAQYIARALEDHSKKRARRDDKNLKSLANMIRRTAQ